MNRSSFWKVNTFYLETSRLLKPKSGNFSVTGPLGLKLVSIPARPLLYGLSSLDIESQTYLCTLRSCLN